MSNPAVVGYCCGQLSYLLNPSVIFLLLILQKESANDNEYIKKHLKEIIFQLCLSRQQWQWAFWKIQSSNTWLRSYIIAFEVFLDLMHTFAAFHRNMFTYRPRRQKDAKKIEKTLKVLAQISALKRLREADCQKVWGLKLSRLRLKVFHALCE